MLQIYFIFLISLNEEYLEIVKLSLYNNGHLKNTDDVDHELQKCLVYFGTETLFDINLNIAIKKLPGGKFLGFFESRYRKRVTKITNSIGDNHILAI
jgi:hypothetical protein